MSDRSSDVKQVFIVPHTHWDREWYLPFQEFRFKLVNLIDTLLDILDSESYCFTLDGQTIILEDYFDIRPGNQERLVSHIKTSRIQVGPWYVLPDIWLAGEESLIRNLEYSFDLASSLDIPLMSIAYLPDMFGHSKTIPQIIGDLTDFDSAIVWRGVPPEITTVPFYWKSDLSAKKSILAVYLPFGYGNAAGLSEDAHFLEKEIIDNVNQLEPFSPLPVYLLQHGTDHQFPRAYIVKAIQDQAIPGYELKVATLDHFMAELQRQITSSGYEVPQYTGEFRSSARANLLQDTYSTRIWIKIWNQRIEDHLVHYAEPLSAYLWYYFKREYPAGFLKEAWKWHLRNQPHDSICGCSVDQIHEEMRTRFYWAESLAKTIVEEAMDAVEKQSYSTEVQASWLIFNPSNCDYIPVPVYVSTTGEELLTAVETDKGEVFSTQEVRQQSDIVWEMSVGVWRFRALLQMLPGRKILNYYVNDIRYYKGEDPQVCEIRIIVGNSPIGDLDPKKLKTHAQKLLDSKEYDFFHILVSKERQTSYLVTLPLKAWGFTEIYPSLVLPQSQNVELFAGKDKISNSFFTLKFQKRGTFDVLDHATNAIYENLHVFEDWGDRGDEYTFGRLAPEYARPMNAKRTLLVSGPLMVELRQNLDLEIYMEVNDSRDSRTGKVRLPVITHLRIYRDIPRIDIKTTIRNISKDHRLRVCFDLPFKTNRTITSTHFGYIKRRSDPEKLEQFMEQPSGIQPQKRFIRVEDDDSEAALTLINKGLPEVELEAGTRLALTLIRSIGWLSRSDFPERPNHAGPYIPTPGAQELGTEFHFEYSLFFHSKSEPISKSADHAEMFSLPTKSKKLNTPLGGEKLTQPLIEIDHPNIRISSLRVRQEALYVTIYNLSGESTNAKVTIASNLHHLEVLSIYGKVRSRYESEGTSINIDFDPFEIKLCRVTE
ncbi:MAG: glycoside hydrolase family 38 C-terminal domain-containing protein [Candidatus Heimdallarchaeota archaeon]